MTPKRIDVATQVTAIIGGGRKNGIETSSAQAKTPPAIWDHLLEAENSKNVAFAGGSTQAKLG
jgi:hypothetical protein